jgi:hypothetical protein
LLGDIKRFCTLLGGKTEGKPGYSTAKRKKQGFFFLKFGFPLPEPDERKDGFWVSGMTVREYPIGGIAVFDTGQL